MRVLIFEDEQPTAVRLVSMLNEIKPSIQVLKVIDSVKEGIQWYQTENQTPDLIFQDIMLKDGDCFEIYREVDIKAPVIFTTAYDQYAIQSFEVNSISYLLKPLDQDDLKKALSKFDELKKPSLNLSELIGLIQRKEEKKLKSRFLIKANNKLTLLSTGNIAYIYSKDSISFAVDFNDHTHVLEETVAELVTVLDPELFFRLNRGVILNINAIEKIESGFNSRLKIKVNTRQKIDFIVSRERVRHFKAWLQGNS